MGNYLIIPKRTSKKLLEKWFNKYKPFYNDFGDEHGFDDIFGDKDFRGNIRFKYGVMDKNFFSQKALKEIKKIKGVKEI